MIRDLEFAETFRDVEARIRNRKRCSALTVEVVDLEVAAGLEFQLLVAIFAAERHRDRAFRPRRLNAVFAEIARDGTAEDLLHGPAFLEALGRNVLLLVRGHGADAVEDVQRHAGVVDSKLRDRTSGDAGAIIRDFQGVLDARFRPFVAIALREQRDAQLRVSVV
jgi:hypothetical protein